MNAKASESKKVVGLVSPDSEIPPSMLGEGENAGATAGLCYATLRRMRRRVNAHAAALREEGAQDAKDA